jgi:hypothetical protein
MSSKRFAFINTLLVLVCGTGTLYAQQPATTARPDCVSPADHVDMDHTAHEALMAKCGAVLPTLPGQAAFGAISEVVRLLTADPTTDWSRVNIEALRQHLIDMDDVTMHAIAAQRNVPGGVEIDVTGAGRTAEAIRRIVVNHARMLDQGPAYRSHAVEIPNGARMTVTAKNTSDNQLVTRIRGLGFAGLWTEGNHHAAHHLALARGDAKPHGR